jgi:restriction endonuclease Mrr
MPIPKYDEMHGVGVSEEHAYSVKRIDSEYFDEA